MSMKLRKFLSLLLALMLAVSPVAVCAEGLEDTEPAEPAELVLPAETEEEPEVPEPVEEEPELPEEAAPAEVQPEDAVDAEEPAVSADGVVASGECGKNVRWSLDDTGTLTLSGTGSTDDWSPYQSKTPWKDYNGEIHSVVIGEGITRVGTGAFMYCNNLETVTFPESLESLGDSCFFYCQYLQAVSFGSNLKSLGEGCFMHCMNLKSAELPFGLTSMGIACFNNTGLQSIVIPDSVTVLENQCFCNCFSMDSAVLPAGLTRMGEYNFSYAPLKNGVVLPETLTYIGENCFQYCNFTSLRIPAKVSHIGEANFVGCRKAVFEIDPGNTSYTIENGMLMDAAKTTVLRMFDTTVKGMGGSVDASVFPASVRTLGPYCFGEIYGLKSIALPEGITTLGDNCFHACWDMQNIVLPDSVTYMGEMCFYFCREMKEFTFPAGLTRLEENVLRYCDGLKEIAIPAQITSIGKGAFSLCYNLETIRFEGDAPLMDAEIFDKVKEAAAYYPSGAKYWDASVLQGYGGNITWISDGSVRAPETDSLCLQDYLAMQAGDTAQLKLSGVSEKRLGDLVWMAENAEEGAEPVVSVEADGTVTALNPGTAYVTVTLEVDGIVTSDSCRIDVTEKPVIQTVSGVSLTDSKATVNLYSDQYTRVNVLLSLPQNMTVSSISADSFGAAVEHAEFVDSETAKAFSLTVVDDRTLEIAPTAAALNDAGNVKSGYKSAVNVTVDGEIFTTKELTLTVKKTLPKLKAASVKINSFSEQLYPVSISGGKVIGLRPDGQLPWGFAVVGTAIRYTGSSQYSTRLKLLARVEGCAVELPLTVSVSVGVTEPTVKLKPASVTLAAGTMDQVSVKYTVSLTQFADLPLMMTLTDASGAPANGQLDCSCSGGVITVAANSSTRAGMSYKLTVNVAGSSRKAVLKIKAVSVGAMTVKTSGAIDLAVPGSPVNLTAKIANYRMGSGEQLMAAVKAPDGSNVSRKFAVSQSAGVLTLTAADTDLTPGSYTAAVGADFDNDGTPEIVKEVKFTVKQSDASKVPASVALKAAGSIDVLRPGTSVVLTPVWKNWYYHTADASDLVFYTVSGKTLTEITEAVPFRVEIVDGRYVIYSEGADSGVKYSVALKAQAGETTCVSKPVSLSIKMGKVRILQSIKSAALLKNDKYDRVIVHLEADDPAMRGIARVMQDSASAASYTVTDLGGGNYAIGFAGHKVPAKGATVKLQVFLKGNLTAKANAAVSVKITLK